MKFDILFLLLVPGVLSYEDDNSNTSKYNQYNGYAKRGRVPGGKTRHFKWDIKNEFIAPANYGLEVITIGGQYPGPKIECNVWDTIVVDIQNYLEGNFTMHWHGMLQKGTVEADGVPFVTQDPIPPGGHYRYKFDVTDQAGTWWYHAHVGLDSEQAAGPLIVRDSPKIYNDLISHDPQFDYDEERIMLLQELRFKPLNELYAGLLSKNFSWVGNPNAVMTNGKTYQIWNATGIDNSTLPFNYGYEVINVKQGNKYRLRLIGGIEVLYLSLKIPGHTFTLIEVDGTYIEPIEVDYVLINPGQRYSVILHADQPIDNYYMCLQQTGSNNGCGNGNVILHYEGAESTDKLVKAEKKFNIPSPPLTRWEENFHTNEWYNKGLLKHYYKVPMKVNHRIHLSIASESDAEGHRFFTVNNHRHIPRNTTLWHEIIDNTYPGEEPGVQNIREGDSIEIIYEHLALNDNKTCIVHPWHLHGHSFYVVGFGRDAYKDEYSNYITESLRKDKNIPVLRDTFTHYPGFIDKPLLRSGINTFKSLESDFTIQLASEHDFSNAVPNINPQANPDKYVSCGWYAIRFIADNPGTWFMHCHITPHLVMGKELIINEERRRRAYY